MHLGSFVDSNIVMYHRGEIDRETFCDPGDELVLEAAVNGQADAIVTFNEKHLREARRFGIAVIRPAEVLRRMNQLRRAFPHFLCVCQSR